MIDFRANFFIVAAFLLLCLPMRWLLSVTMAALMHECCHVIAVLLLKEEIKNISVSAGGCIIETYPMGRWQQVICILAGPVGGLSLLAVRQFFPEAAVFGMFHSVFNLIPILPLDGGRLLLLILEALKPDQADKIMLMTEKGVFLILSATALWGLFTFKVAFGFFFILLLCALRMVHRKIPCKPLQIKVQYH